MTKIELLELISNGENSTVEFKRDDVRPESLAKEMSALLNHRGGIILLGVEDDLEISGMTREHQKAEEWVMNIARENIEPSNIPSFHSINMDGDKQVGIIELFPETFSKPYKARTGQSRTAYVRVGSTSREASRQEEMRLYQSAGSIKYETRPVPDMKVESLDLRRIENYFGIILDQSVPEPEERQDILLNSDLLVKVEDDVVLTSVAGQLLFGKNPNRRLHQAGIMAVAFPDVEKEYNVIEEDRIRGPLVSRFSPDRSVVDSGVIDRSVDFVKRNMSSVAWLEGARRHVKKSYPLAAVREAIVNAVVHRDYSREGTDIEVSLYKDRLEIISPDELPNGVTIENMKQGVVRETRNGLIKEILRDYRYVDHFGMGVRNRIIKGMRDHNGTEPEFINENDRFMVRLWESTPQS